MSWFNNNEYEYLQGSSTMKEKIFAFDLDGTLIVYKNSTNPKTSTNDPDNWSFIGDIKSKIKELNDSYTIIIVTNQLKLSDGKRKLIENVYMELDCIPHILMSRKKNNYRKPNNGFLSVIQYLVNKYNLTLDNKNSYYCGDACGPNDPFPPYRWSDVDYLFSVNIGFNFVRPCDIFIPFTWPNFIEDGKCKYNVILLMGSPGSGKTTISKLLESNFGYVRFSQDEYDKKLTKHTELICNTLQQGKNIVLDATFGKPENRNMWFDMFDKFLPSDRKYAIIWSIRDGRHFNELREEPISHFAYSGKYGYTKNFVSPEETNLYGYDVIKFY